MSNIHQCSYISLFIYAFYSIVLLCNALNANKVMNDNEEILDGNADASYPGADPDAS